MRLHLSTTLDMRLPTASFTPLTDPKAGRFQGRPGFATNSPPDPHDGVGGHVVRRSCSTRHVAAKVTPLGVLYNGVSFMHQGVKPRQLSHESHQARTSVGVAPGCQGLLLRMLGRCLVRRQLDDIAALGRGGLAAVMCPLGPVTFIHLVAVPSSFAASSAGGISLTL